MKPLYLVILIGCVLVGGGLIAWSFLGGSPAGASKLASRALTASEESERIKAVVGLTMIKEFREAVPQLRHVAKETQDPEVLVIALGRLSSFSDTESLPLFFTGLDHPDKKVRTTAFEAVKKFNNNSLPDKLKYNVDDPPAKRALVARRLQELHDNPPPIP